MPSLPSFLPVLAEMRPAFYFVFLIPVFGMVLALLVIALSSHFRDRELQRRHETARLALEKGQPIPAFSDAWSASAPKPTQQKSWVGLMIGGLINIAVGVGLFIMLTSISGAYEARWAAVIPGLVGVALLLSALIVGVTSLTRSDAGDHPPVS